MKIEAALGVESQAKTEVFARSMEVPTGIFADVLQEVAPSEKSTEKADAIAALEESFFEWREGLDTSHPLNRPRFDAVTAESQRFLQIVAKAVDEDGFSNPIEFLKGLSGGELETLRVMHSLADPIDPSGISEEGALNLILPVSEKRDIDNDGFVETGEAVGWSFPPLNAPESVHEAWAKTTEGMTVAEKMMAEAMFLPSMIRVDDNGKVSEVERSEANNPYAKNGFSFIDFIEDRLESVEAFKLQMTGEQYAFQKSTLTDFLTQLTDSGLG